jgi:hypothetical protein
MMMMQSLKRWLELKIGISLMKLNLPAKSPDLNVLDLSLFEHFSHAHQWRSGFANTVEELILQFERAYREFETRKIDFAFLTPLQCCIDNTLSIHSSNDYHIRHMGNKKAMLHAGTLPVSIVPSATALQVLDMLEGRHELVVMENQGEFLP